MICDFCSFSNIKQDSYNNKCYCNVEKRYILKNKKDCFYYETNKITMDKAFKFIEIKNINKKEN